MTEYKRWTLAKHPSGVPSEDCFALESFTPDAPQDGQVLIRTHYFSLDPGMRGRLSGDSYAAGLKIGDTIESAGIGEIIASKSERFAVGDMVMGGLGWTQALAHPDRGLQKLDPALFDDKVAMTATIGVLGVPGLTAWFGLQDLGQPQAGETLLISSAAGPVGATCGQIGKTLGLSVIGIAGGADKCAYLTDLGFDSVIDYKAEDNLVNAIEAAAPDGVDIYFDNVGGEMLDAAILNMKPKGRIVVSGQVAEYNREKPVGIRQTTRFITHRLRMEGLVVYDCAKQFPEAQAAMAALIRDGKLAYKEDISDGIEDAPRAYAALFAGANFGRRLIKAT
ncbi:NADP-dependent oxidoreductase [Alphaproteobacteria bacterium]|nr:NADP-dependent oxidoreductase [Alphaproteobacteria bacterium]MDA8622532.1 NADP-dependent oxidoreductase [bacterium]MDA8624997.1 NADP-dependent oxidoreductase [Alphaproteobacteria bacterium]MDA8780049.1 NADP-dependent oxidoreductase [Alphaproteobacteria bacterium]MDB2381588.1 NADP-dependent oxidoreductase [Alphaproteobacteria bacterium]